MYSFFLAAHSIWRYFVLAIIVVALFSALRGLVGKKPFVTLGQKTALWAVIASHSQLLLGFVLYALSRLVHLADFSVAMKIANWRYWSLEHVSMMVLAVVFITVGYSRAKRASSDWGKHKAIALFFTLALLFIVVGILRSGRGLL